MIIYKIADIDLNTIEYSKKKNNIIFLSKDGNPILLETPELYCVDKIEEIKTKYSTHSLLVTLCGKDDNFFEALDDKFVADGKKNMDKWGTRGFIYKSIVRNVDDKDSGDCYDNGAVKLKFIKSKNFNTLVFDENKNIINPSDYSNKLNGDMYIKTILELVGLWFRDNVYGIYIKLHQVKLCKKPKICKQLYAFMDSNSSSDCDNDVNNLVYDTECQYYDCLDSIMLRQKSREIDDFEYVLS